MTLTSEITDAPRVAKGRKPPHLAPKTRPQRGDKRYGRSRVTNGQSLFVVGKGTSPFARRFADILAEIVSDLGGADQLSEAQRQLARRAASLSLACERIEAVVCDGSSSAAEAVFTEASGGLSPYAILAEAGRILHGIARVRGGADGVRAMAALPPDELDRIVDFLTKAGDLAAKAIAAGSEAQTSNCSARSPTVAAGRSCAWASSVSRARWNRFRTISRAGRPSFPRSRRP